MGDPSETKPDGIKLDFYPRVTERRQRFEEWLQDRREIYKQVQRPDIPEPLVTAVEAFRLDQTFTLRRLCEVDFCEVDFPTSGFVFELHDRWEPGEDDYLDDPRYRATVVHECINGQADAGVPITTAGEALAVILYARLGEVERQGAAPVRGQGQLSRRAIADVAYDLLRCQLALVGAPGPALLKLLEKLLGVEDRRQKSGRRFQAKQAAIAIEAEQPGLSSRKLGALVGVDSTTITRWRKEPEYKTAVDQARRPRREE